MVTQSNPNNGAAHAANGSTVTRAQQIREANEIATLAAQGHSDEEIAKAYNKTPVQVRMIRHGHERKTIRHKFRPPFLDLPSRALRAFDVAGIYSLAEVDKLDYERTMRTPNVGQEAWDDIVKWKTDNSAAIARAKLQADQAHIRHVAAAPSKTEVVRRGGLLGGNGKSTTPMPPMAYAPLRATPAPVASSIPEAPKAQFHGKFCPHCGEKLV